MTQDGYNAWYTGRLQDLVAASNMSAEAANGNGGSIQSDKLRSMLEEGARIAKQQGSEMQKMLEQAGEKNSKSVDKVLQGINDAGKENIPAVKDPAMRDLAVIAITQVGLHYYIAAYGTLKTIAKALGKSDDAKTFNDMEKHITEKDSEYTELGLTLLNAE